MTDVPDPSRALARLAQRVVDAPTSSTVAIADQVTALRGQGETVYDFSAGRAFESTPDAVVAAANRALAAGDTHQTPARGTTAFRRACARKLERDSQIVADPTSEIVATMGTKQGLTIAFLALLNDGDEVLVEDPCFVSYQALISWCGGRAVPVRLRSERGFRWDREDLKRAVTPRTRALLLNSPHNPTGTVHTRADLEMVASFAREHDLMVVTDEIYERMTWGDREHLCLASLPGMKQRTITLQGLTKSFSMGGWRIGFAYASPVIASQLEKLQQHLITCPNSFVQAGAIQAFGEAPDAQVLGYWRQWEEKCRQFCARLDGMEGIRCRVPEGGFYAWVDIRAITDDDVAFAARLLREAKVACVPGSTFGEGGKGFLRLTCVKSHEENEAGLRAFQAFLSPWET